jgi:hypothetical protein
VLIERKIIAMKLNSVLLAGLVSISLLTIGADSAFAGGHFGFAGGHFSVASPGGYFSAGNPGGLPAASSYRLAPTPANQAFERNNAWANYAAQNRSTGTSGSVSQHNGATP